jgi:hypothetical protein
MSGGRGLGFLKGRDAIPIYSSLSLGLLVERSGGFLDVSLG